MSGTSCFTYSEHVFHDLNDKNLIKENGYISNFWYRQSSEVFLLYLSSHLRDIRVPLSSFGKKWHAIGGK